MINSIRQFFYQVLSIFYKTRSNIIFIKPDYWIVDNLTPKSKVIDIGLGFDADFSVNLINKYKLKTYGFDPTKKHHQGLLSIQNMYPNNFRLYKYAIAAKNMGMTFYETQDNVSGSLIPNHKNITNDKIIKYQVKAIDLKKVLKLSNVKKPDLIKIDIEGEEYNLLSNDGLNIIKNINQIIIEFHHGTVPKYTKSDTLTLVNKIKSLGFNFLCIDGRNYLFYKRKINA